MGGDILDPALFQRCAERLSEGAFPYFQFQRRIAEPHRLIEEQRRAVADYDASFGDEVHA